jgi:hypothetical protein
MGDGLLDSVVIGDEGRYRSLRERGSSEGEGLDEGRIVCPRQHN